MSGCDGRGHFAKFYETPQFANINHKHQSHAEKFNFSSSNLIKFAIIFKRISESYNRSLGFNKKKRFCIFNFWMKFFKQLRVLTRRLSGFEILNNATLIFQKWLVSMIFPNIFIIWIFLKHINDNFRNFSWQFVITIFLKIIIWLWT